MPFAPKARAWFFEIIAFTLGIDGNRLGIVETRGETSDEWVYEYDELGRLTREKRDADKDGSFERDVAYTCDLDSNRKTVTRDGIVKTYCYEGQEQNPDAVPTSNRLVQITEAAVLREAFTWTADGQQKTHTQYDAAGDPETKHRYTWGWNDTLVKVERQDWDDIHRRWKLTGHAEYTYDNTGTLIGRKQFDGTGALVDHEKYLVDRLNPTAYSQVVAEIDGETNQLRQLNTFDALGIKAQHEANSDARHSLHRDALGSVRALTGTTAQGNPLAEEYNYTAFGSPLTDTARTTPYAFTGQPRDNFSELQYHRARWLNTGLGQWLSVDPYFDFPANFGSNYGYAGQNSILYSDCTGKSSYIEMCVASAIHAMLVTAAFGSARLAFVRIRNALMGKGNAPFWLGKRVFLSILSILIGWVILF